jgi:hypothetical protein
VDKTFKNDLQTHIHNLGVKNGKFKLTSSQHTLDPLLHEGFIGDNLQSIGKQRRETARDQLKKELYPDIGRIIETTRKLNTTQNETLLETGNYRMDIQCKRPSVKLDTTRLRNELIKRGMSMHDVDVLWAECSEDQSPVSVLTINTI